MERFMLNNWTELLTKVRSAGMTFGKANPKFIAAYRGLNEAQAAGSVLDAKTRELIALAVAVTTRCDGCIASHVEAARKAGVTQAELAEALGTAIALNAGAAYVYSVRAMEAFGQFEEIAAVK
jgi:AhpD family alkylhydroperoxidase